LGWPPTFTTAALPFPSWNGRVSSGEPTLLTSSPATAISSLVGEPAAPFSYTFGVRFRGAAPPRCDPRRRSGRRDPDEGVGGRPVLALLRRASVGERGAVRGAGRSRPARGRHLLRARERRRARRVRRLEQARQALHRQRRRSRRRPSA